MEIKIHNEVCVCVCLHGWLLLYVQRNTVTIIYCEDQSNQTS